MASGCCCFGTQAAGVCVSWTAAVPDPGGKAEKHLRSVFSSQSSDRFIILGRRTRWADGQSVQLSAACPRQAETPHVVPTPVGLSGDRSPDSGFILARCFVCQVCTLALGFVPSLSLTFILKFLSCCYRAPFSIFFLLISVFSLFFCLLGPPAVMRPRSPILRFGTGASYSVACCSLAQPGLLHHPWVWMAGLIPCVRCQ